jgi:hypothetical protein
MLGKAQSEYRDLTGKPEGKKQLGRLMPKWKDIKNKCNGRVCN